MAMLWKARPREKNLDTPFRAERPPVKESRPRQETLGVPFMTYNSAIARDFTNVYRSTKGHVIAASGFGLNLYCDMCTMSQERDSYEEYLRLLV